LRRAHGAHLLIAEQQRRVGECDRGSRSLALQHQRDTGNVSVEGDRTLAEERFKRATAGVTILIFAGLVGGITFKWARRYDDSLAQFQKVNQMDPNFPLNHERLAQLYAILGKFEEAVTEETKARLLAGEKQQDVLAKMNALRRELTVKGEHGYWEERLQLARDRQNPPEAYFRPYGLAIIYAHLGEKGKAFENLENALAERDTQMTELAIEPQFDVLRPDARFAELERRIGLLPR
jgi:tetratricopeptide (TPR) repeat protein